MSLERGSCFGSPARKRRIPARAGAWQGGLRISATWIYVFFGNKWRAIRVDRQRGGNRDETVLRPAARLILGLGLLCASAWAANPPPVVTLTSPVSGLSVYGPT